MYIHVHVHVGVPNYFDGDSSDELDPVKIWDHHSKEIVEQLGYSNTLVALTSGFHIGRVIDKETKNIVTSASSGRGDILVKAVKETIAGPETLCLVLDVMDRFEGLCGLVTKMRRELKRLEGYYSIQYNTIVGRNRSIQYTLK